MMRAPPEGSNFRLTGKRVLCETFTTGDKSTLEQKIECKDEVESTVEPPILPILRATAPKLRRLCRWK